MNNERRYIGNHQAGHPYVQGDMIMQNDADIASRDTPEQGIRTVAEIAQITTDTARAVQNASSYLQNPTLLEQHSASLLPHEALALTREERTRRLWEKRQKEWTKFRSNISSRLKRSEDESIAALVDDHRARQEEINVLQALRPTDESESAQDWKASLRGGGSHFVLVGNAFTGLWCPVPDKKQENERLIVKETIRRPLPPTTRPAGGKDDLKPDLAGSSESMLGGPNSSPTRGERAGDMDLRGASFASPSAISYTGHDVAAEGVFEVSPRIPRARGRGAWRDFPEIRRKKEEFAEKLKSLRPVELTDVKVAKLVVHTAPLLEWASRAVGAEYSRLGVSSVLPVTSSLQMTPSLMSDHPQRGEKQGLAEGSAWSLSMPVAPEFSLGGDLEDSFIVLDGNAKDVQYCDDKDHSGAGIQYSADTSVDIVYWKQKQALFDSSNANHNISISAMKTKTRMIDAYRAMLLSHKDRRLWKPRVASGFTSSNPHAPHNLNPSSAYFPAAPFENPLTHKYPEGYISNMQGTEKIVPLVPLHTSSIDEYYANLPSNQQEIYPINPDSLIGTNGNKKKKSKSGRDDIFDEAADVRNAAAELLTGPHLQLVVLKDSATDEKQVGASFGPTGPLMAFSRREAGEGAKAAADRGLEQRVASAQLDIPPPLPTAGVLAFTPEVFEACSNKGTGWPMVFLEGPVNTNVNGIIRIANVGSVVLHFSWSIYTHPIVARAIQQKMDPGQFVGTEESEAHHSSYVGIQPNFSGSAKSIADANAHLTGKPGNNPLLVHTVHPTPSTYLPLDSIATQCTHAAMEPYHNHSISMLSDSLPMNISQTLAPVQMPEPSLAGTGGFTNPLSSEPFTTPLSAFKTSKFIIGRPTGSIAPGKTLDVPITFKNSQPGVFQESWVLVTSPPLLVHNVALTTNNTMNIQASQGHHQSEPEHHVKTKTKTESAVLEVREVKVLFRGVSTSSYEADSFPGRNRLEMRLRSAGIHALIREVVQSIISSLALPDPSESSENRIQQAARVFVQRNIGFRMQGTIGDQALRGLADVSDKICKLIQEQERIFANEGAIVPASNASKSSKSDLATSPTSMRREGEIDSLSSPLSGGAFATNKARQELQSSPNPRASSAYGMRAGGATRPTLTSPNATGALSKPLLPDIVGLDTYRASLVSSSSKARKQEDIELSKAFALIDSRMLAEKRRIRKSLDRGGPDAVHIQGFPTWTGRAGKKGRGIKWMGTVRDTIRLILLLHVAPETPLEALRYAEMKALAWKNAVRDAYQQERKRRIQQRIEDIQKQEAALQEEKEREAAAASGRRSASDRRSASQRGRAGSASKDGANSRSDSASSQFKSTPGPNAARAPVRSFFPQDMDISALQERLALEGQGGSSGMDPFLDGDMMNVQECDAFTLATDSIHIDPASVPIPPIVSPYEQRKRMLEATKQELSIKAADAVLVLEGKDPLLSPYYATVRSWVIDLVEFIPYIAGAARAAEGLDCETHTTQRSLRKRTISSRTGESTPASTPGIGLRNVVRNLLNLNIRESKESRDKSEESIEALHTGVSSSNSSLMPFPQQPRTANSNVYSWTDVDYVEYGKQYQRLYEEFEKQVSRNRASISESIPLSHSSSEFSMAGSLYRKPTTSGFVGKMNLDKPTFFHQDLLNRGEGIVVGTGIRICDVSGPADVDYISILSNPRNLIRELLVQEAKLTIGMPIMPPTPKFDLELLNNPAINVNDRSNPTAPISVVIPYEDSLLPDSILEAISAISPRLLGDIITLIYDIWGSKGRRTPPKRMATTRLKLGRDGKYHAVPDSDEEEDEIENPFDSDDDGPGSGAASSNSSVISGGQSQYSIGRSQASGATGYSSRRTVLDEDDEEDDFLSTFGKGTEMDVYGDLTYAVDFYNVFATRFGHSRITIPKMESMTKEELEHALKDAYNVPLAQLSPAFAHLDPDITFHHIAKFSSMLLRRELSNQDTYVKWYKRLNQEVLYSLKWHEEYQGALQNYVRHQLKKMEIQKKRQTQKEQREVEAMLQVQEATPLASTSRAKRPTGTANSASDGDRTKSSASTPPASASLAKKGILVRGIRGASQAVPNLPSTDSEDELEAEEQRILNESVPFPAFVPPVTSLERLVPHNVLMKHALRVDRLSKEELEQQANHAAESIHASRRMSSTMSTHHASTPSSGSHSNTNTPQAEFGTPQSPFFTPLSSAVWGTATIGGGSSLRTQNPTGCVYSKPFFESSASLIALSRFAWAVKRTISRRLQDLSRELDLVSVAHVRGELDMKSGLIKSSVPVNAVVVAPNPYNPASDSLVSPNQFRNTTASEAALVANDSDAGASPNGGFAPSVGAKSALTNDNNNPSSVNDDNVSVYSHGSLQSDAIGAESVASYDSTPDQSPLPSPGRDGVTQQASVDSVSSTITGMSSLVSVAWAKNQILKKFSGFALVDRKRKIQEFNAFIIPPAEHTGVDVNAIAQLGQMNIQSSIVMVRPEWDLLPHILLRAAATELASIKMQTTRLMFAAKIGLTPVTIYGAPEGAVPGAANPNASQFMRSMSRGAMTASTVSDPRNNPSPPISEALFVPALATHKLMNSSVPTLLHILWGSLLTANPKEVIRMYSLIEKRNHKRGKHSIADDEAFDNLLSDHVTDSEFEEDVAKAGQPRASSGSSTRTGRDIEYHGVRISDLNLAHSMSNTASLTVIIASQGSTRIGGIEEDIKGLHLEVGFENDPSSRTVSTMQSHAVAQAVKENKHVELKLTQEDMIPDVDMITSLTTRAVHVPITISRTVPAFSQSTVATASTADRLPTGNATFEEIPGLSNFSTPSTFPIYDIKNPITRAIKEKLDSVAAAASQDSATERNAMSTLLNLQSEFYLEPVKSSTPLYTPLAPEGLLYSTEAHSLMAMPYIGGNRSDMLLTHLRETVSETKKFLNNPYTGIVPATQDAPFLQSTSEGVFLSHQLIHVPQLPFHMDSVIAGDGHASATSSVNTYKSNVLGSVAKPHDPFASKANSLQVSKSRGDLLANHRNLDSVSSLVEPRPAKVVEQPPQLLLDSSNTTVASEAEQAKKIESLENTVYTGLSTVRKQYSASSLVGAAAAMSLVLANQLVNRVTEINNILLISAGRKEGPVNTNYADSNRKGSLLPPMSTQDIFRAAPWVLFAPMKSINTRTIRVFSNGVELDLFYMSQYYTLKENAEGPVWPAFGKERAHYSAFPPTQTQAQLATLILRLCEQELILPEFTRALSSGILSLEKEFLDNLKNTSVQKNTYSGRASVSSANSTSSSAPQSHRRNPKLPSTPLPRVLFVLENLQDPATCAYESGTAREWIFTSAMQDLPYGSGSSLLDTTPISLWSSVHGALWLRSALKSVPKEGTWKHVEKILVGVDPSVFEPNPPSNSAGSESMTLRAPKSILRDFVPEAPKPNTEPAPSVVSQPTPSHPPRMPPIPSKLPPIPPSTPSSKAPIPIAPAQAQLTPLQVLQSLNLQLPTSIQPAVPPQNLSLPAAVCMDGKSMIRFAQTVFSVQPLPSEVQEAYTAHTAQCLAHVRDAIQQKLSTLEPEDANSVMSSVTPAKRKGSASGKPQAPPKSSKKPLASAVVVPEPEPDMNALSPELTSLLLGGVGGATYTLQPQDVQTAVIPEFVPPILTKLSPLERLRAILHLAIESSARKLKKSFRAATGLTSALLRSMQSLNSFHANSFKEVDQIISKSTERNVFTPLSIKRGSVSTLYQSPVTISRGIDGVSDPSLETSYISDDVLVALLSSLATLLARSSVENVAIAKSATLSSWLVHKEDSYLASLAMSKLCIASAVRIQSMMRALIARKRAEKLARTTGKRIPLNVFALNKVMSTNKGTSQNKGTDSRFGTLAQQATNKPQHRTGTGHLMQVVGKHKVYGDKDTSRTAMTADDSNFHNTAIRLASSVPSFSAYAYKFSRVRAQVAFHAALSRACDFFVLDSVLGARGGTASTEYIRPAYGGLVHYDETQVHRWNKSNKLSRRFLHTMDSSNLPSPVPGVSPVFGGSTNGHRIPVSSLHPKANTGRDHVTAESFFNGLAESSTRMQRQNNTNIHAIIPANPSSPHKFNHAQSHYFATFLLRQKMNASRSLLKIINSATRRVSGFYLHSQLSASRPFLDPTVKGLDAVPVNLSLSLSLVKPALLQPSKKKRKAVASASENMNILDANEITSISSDSEIEELQHTPDVSTELVETQATTTPTPNAATVALLSKPLVAEATSSQAITIRAKKNKSLSLEETVFRHAEESKSFFYPSGVALPITGNINMTLYSSDVLSKAISHGRHTNKTHTSDGSEGIATSLLPPVPNSPSFVIIGGGSEDLIKQAKALEYMLVTPTNVIHTVVIGGVLAIAWICHVIHPNEPSVAMSGLRCVRSILHPSRFSSTDPHSYTVHDVLDYIPSNLDMQWWAVATILRSCYFLAKRKDVTVVVPEDFVVLTLTIPKPDLPGPVEAYFESAAEGKIASQVAAAKTLADPVDVDGESDGTEDSYSEMLALQVSNRKKLGSASTANGAKKPAGKTAGAGAENAVPPGTPKSKSSAARTAPNGGTPTSARVASGSRARGRTPGKETLQAQEAAAAAEAAEAEARAQAALPIFNAEKVKEWNRFAQAKDAALWSPHFLTANPVWDETLPAGLDAAARVHSAQSRSGTASGARSGTRSGTSLHPAVRMVTQSRIYVELASLVKSLLGWSSVTDGQLALLEESLRASLLPPSSASMSSSTTSSHVHLPGLRGIGGSAFDIKASLALNKATSSVTTKLPIRTYSNLSLLQKDKPHPLTEILVTSNATHSKGSVPESPNRQAMKGNVQPTMTALMNAELRSLVVRRKLWRDSLYSQLYLTGSNRSMNAVVLVNTASTLLQQIPNQLPWYVYTSENVLMHRESILGNPFESLQFIANHTPWTPHVVANLLQSLALQKPLPLYNSKKYKLPSDVPMLSNGSGADFGSSTTLEGAFSTSQSSFGGHDMGETSMSGFSHLQLQVDAPHTSDTSDPTAYAGETSSSDDDNSNVDEDVRDLDAPDSDFSLKVCTYRFGRRKEASRNNAQGVPVDLEVRKWLPPVSKPSRRDDGADSPSQSDAGSVSGRKSAHSVRSSHSTSQMSAMSRVSRAMTASMMGTSATTPTKKKRQPLVKDLMGYNDEESSDQTEGYSSDDSVDMLRFLARNNRRRVRKVARKEREKYSNAVRNAVRLCTPKYPDIPSKLAGPSLETMVGTMIPLGTVDTLAGQNPKRRTMLPNTVTGCAPGVPDNMQYFITPDVEAASYTYTWPIHIRDVNKGPTDSSANLTYHITTHEVKVPPITNPLPASLLPFASKSSSPTTHAAAINGAVNGFTAGTPTAASISSVPTPMSSTFNPPAPNPANPIPGMNGTPLTVFPEHGTIIDIGPKTVETIVQQLDVYCKMIVAHARQIIEDAEMHALVVGNASKEQKRIVNNTPVPLPSATVLVYGPLGITEIPAGSEGTQAVLAAVADIGAQYANSIKSIVSLRQSMDLSASDSGRKLTREGSRVMSRVMTASVMSRGNTGTVGNTSHGMRSALSFDAPLSTFLNMLPPVTIGPIVPSPLKVVLVGGATCAFAEKSMFTIPVAVEAAAYDTAQKSIHVKVQPANNVVGSLLDPTVDESAIDVVLRPHAPISSHNGWNRAYPLLVEKQQRTGHVPYLLTSTKAKNKQSDKDTLLPVIPSAFYGEGLGAGKAGAFCDWVTVPYGAVLFSNNTRALRGLKSLSKHV